MFQRQRFETRLFFLYLVSCRLFRKKITEDLQITLSVPFSFPRMHAFHFHCPFSQPSVLPLIHDLIIILSLVRERRGQARGGGGGGREEDGQLSSCLSFCLSLVLVLAGRFEAAVTADGPQSLCWVCSQSGRRSANLQGSFIIALKLHPERE